MDNKFFLKSLTIWGALVAGIPPLLNIIGITPSPDDIKAIDEGVRSLADQGWALFNNVNVFVGTVMAIIGRIKAKKALTLTPTKGT